MNTVYIVGEPGVGKSTFMDAIFCEYEDFIIHRNPLPHVEYTDGKSLWPPGSVAQLGIPKALGSPFPGTDQLSFTAIQQAEPWVRSKPFDWLFAEGDRLAVDRFLKACVESGELYLVWLRGQEVAAQRRTARLAGGKPQFEEWVDGRRTKIHNLIGRWNHIQLDAKRSPTELVEDLKEAIRDRVPRA